MKQKRYTEEQIVHALKQAAAGQKITELCRVMSDAEIAALLGLTPRTVETHRHRILRKLDLDSTPKLMKFAIDHDFTDFGGPGLPAPSCVA